MTWTPYDKRGRPNTPRSDPRDIGQLAEPLRSRAAQMIADCPYKGELGIVSGLRDPGTQWDLRDQRVGRRNIWTSPPTGSPVTAVPARWNGREWEGGSKHQTGKANDFGGTERAMRWMHVNRERYGLARTVRTERWHMEADRRDVLTGRVHDRPTVPIATWGKPAGWTAPTFPGTIRKGSPAEQVAAWRVLLGALKYKGFKVGVYPWSMTLGAATRRFQRNHGLVADGIVGPKTWAKAVARLIDVRRKAGLPT